MENIGIAIVVALIVIVIIALVVGRTARKRETAAEAKPGNKRPVSAEFSKPGH